jgi:hypothetical protein
MNSFFVPDFFVVCIGFKVEIAAGIELDEKESGAKR